MKFLIEEVFENLFWEFLKLFFYQFLIKNRNCSQFSQNESNQLKEQPTIEIRPGTESDPIHSEEASLNEPILNKNSQYKPDHGSFPSVYLFTVTICFISIYLTNHIVLSK